VRGWSDGLLAEGTPLSAPTAPGLSAPTAGGVCGRAARGRPAEI
jgi:hypothetical protein